MEYCWRYILNLLLYHLWKIDQILSLEITKEWLLRTSFLSTNIAREQSLLTCVDILSWTENHVTNFVLSSNFVRIQFSKKLNWIAFDKLLFYFFFFFNFKTSAQTPNTKIVMEMLQNCFKMCKTQPHVPFYLFRSMRA